MWQNTHNSDNQMNVPPVALNKLRLLSFITHCSKLSSSTKSPTTKSKPSTTFSYKKLKTDAFGEDLSDDDLEQLLIQGMYASLFQGKLSQKTNSFKLEKILFEREVSHSYSNTGNDMSDVSTNSQVTELIRQLTSWRNEVRSISKTLDVVEKPVKSTSSSSRSRGAAFGGGGGPSSSPMNIDVARTSPMPIDAPAASDEESRSSKGTNKRRAS